MKNFVPELWANYILASYRKTSALMDMFYDVVERSFWERLFSLSPFKKYKRVPKVNTPGICTIKLLKGFGFKEQEATQIANRCAEIHKDLAKFTEERNGKN